MANDIISNVDVITAMTLETQRFDKRIAEAEAIVADLKRQKASYIFDTNIQQLQLLAQKRAQVQVQKSS